MSNTGDGVLKHYYGQAKMTKGKLAKSIENLARTSEELKNVQQNQTSAELDVTKLKTENSKANTQIKNLELQIKSLNAKNQKEREEYESVIASLKQEQNAQESNMNYLRQEVQSMKEEMSMMLRKSAVQRAPSVKALSKQPSAVSVKMQSARSSKVDDPMSTQSSNVNLAVATRSSVAAPVITAKVEAIVKAAAAPKKAGLKGSQNSIAATPKSRKHVIKSNENVYGSSSSVATRKKKAVQVVPKEDNTKLSREQLNLHKAVVASNKSLNKNSTRSLAQAHWTY